MNLRVSVIIPARNARETLPKALDSVIAQTYDGWEAIVADDGSTDGTGEALAGYHPRVTGVRSERNLGIGGARNLALTRARGELIALLDADDVWLPTYLERMVDSYDAAVLSGVPVGVVCCDTYEVDGRGTRELTFFERTGWTNPVTLTPQLRHNMIFVSAIVPRALIEELGGFATDCLGAEDYDLWLRILESGRTVVTVREPLVLYSRGETSISANLGQMARATQTVYRHALERGRLDARQRAIVHRELRLQRLIVLWDETVQFRAGTGRLPLVVTIRATLLGTRVILERPNRWRRWAGHVFGILRTAFMRKRITRASPG